MAKAHRLTDSQVRAFKPCEDKDRWKNDGNGLYIRIRPNGKKTWVLRRKIKKVSKKTTLGKEYPKTTLKMARRLAGEERARDEDKAALPEKLSESPTLFGELLNQYYREHVEPSYRRPRQVRMYIDNRVPNHIKELPISDLDEKGTRYFRV